MKTKVKKQKGITLIALVVTIVVLILLAVVTVNLVIGDEGIIARAQSADDIQAGAVEKDKEALAQLGSEIDEHTGEKVYTYSIEEDEVTITGLQNSDYEGVLIIPSTVTEDGVTYNVTSIGASAFSGCSSLTSVSIPDSVNEINNFAFKGCSSLTSVSIPDSVECINDGTFYGCSSLTGVSIPDSVKMIGYNAFEGCISLSSITIPDSVTIVWYDAFDGCNITVTYKGETYIITDGVLPDTWPLNPPEGMS